MRLNRNFRTGDARRRPRRPPRARGGRLAARGPRRRRACPGRSTARCARRPDRPAGSGWSHDRAGGAAGQQRFHLGGVTGVVQHDQCPPAGDQAAVERGLACRLAGMAASWTPRASRNPHTASPGSIGFPAGAVAEQADEQLSVGEPVQALVGRLRGGGCRLAPESGARGSCPGDDPAGSPRGDTALREGGAVANSDRVRLA
jgi:hypothetical protein